MVERRVRNAKARGSNPLISTTFYQSAPVADCFFIFLDFFVQNVNNFIVFSEKHNLSYFEVVQSSLSAHKSFNSTSISIAPSFIAFRRGELAQRKAFVNGIKIL